MLRRKLQKAPIDHLNEVVSEKSPEPPQEKKLKFETESKYFHIESKEHTESVLSMDPIIYCVNDELIKLAKQLNNLLRDLKYPNPIEYCYNPIEYASIPHELYINKYCTDTKTVLFIGMNPGPYGMCQTGVPFGDVGNVRDWMNITGDVSKPKVECPSRPILGFSCGRTEISGQKFWGLFRKLCGVPEIFFRNAFVYNYCPIAFMQGSGKNVTPNMIKVLFKTINVFSTCNGTKYI